MLARAVAPPLTKISVAQSKRHFDKLSIVLIDGTAR
jgi:hypothetical protein